MNRICAWHFAGNFYRLHSVVLPVKCFLAMRRSRAPGKVRVHKCIVCIKEIDGVDAVVLAEGLLKHSSVGDFLLYHGLLPNEKISSANRVCSDCHHNIRMADKGKSILDSAVDHLEKKRRSALSRLGGLNNMSERLGKLSYLTSRLISGALSDFSL